MYAYSDLREAQNTLEKYQVQLTEIVNFENEDKIEILVEFLNKWRAQAYDGTLEMLSYTLNLRTSKKKPMSSLRLKMILV